MFWRREPAKKYQEPQHEDSEEEQESSALISAGSGHTVSETYVVPDINGCFPTDLSDSDDDFFEKKCNKCDKIIQADIGCDCSNQQQHSKSKPNKQTKTDKQTKADKESQHSSRHPDSGTTTHNPEVRTRTKRTYTKEEMDTAKNLQKVTLELDIKVKR